MFGRRKAVGSGQDLDLWQVQFPQVARIWGSSEGIQFEVVAWFGDYLKQDSGQRKFRK